MIEAETNESQVCQYGQQSISGEHISQFFTSQKNISSWSTKVKDSIDQRDATLARLARKIKKYPADKKMFQAQIDEILYQRKRSDLLFEKLRSEFLEEENFSAENNCNACQGFEVTRDFDCFREILTSLEKVCGKFDHYALKYSNEIVR